MYKIAGVLKVGDTFIRNDPEMKYSVEVLSEPEKNFRCCTMCSNMHLSYVSFSARKVDSGEVYVDTLNSIARCEIVKGE